jgi:Peptidase M50B-like
MFNNYIFDLIALIGTIVAVDTIIRLKKNWAEFWDESITTKDRFLIERLAIFIFIPIGVFFHELGHALATWQVGGQIDDFQWHVFWGYVVPMGNFTPLESWWISLSGNVVSITIGLVSLLTIFPIKKIVFKELLYTFATAELMYSLVIYPILSFCYIGGEFTGDWVRIYNFSVEPYAQITLILHILLVIILWQLSKSGWLLDYLRNYSQAMVDPNETEKTSEAISGARRLWRIARTNGQKNINNDSTDERDSHK